MKKVSVLILFIFLFSFAYSLEFRPNTVKEIDIDLTLGATGSFEGEIRSRDRIELKMLTLMEFPNQQILSIDEKLLIGEDEIGPTYKFEEGNKYAVFEIDDLYKYRARPSFEIIINARVKSSALMLLGDDYNLANAITEQTAFLKETDYIEVSDQTLKSKALLEFTSDSELETIREIAEWVNTNIEYDLENYYQGTWSAKQTYNSRRGVCDEFANLTAAFTRIKGIPTKYVTGISFDGEGFGNHGWLEVFLPGSGWVALDSTYGEAGYVDSAHISLAKSADSNDVANITATATTIGGTPPSILTALNNPVVEINSVSFFENLIDVDLNRPEKVGLSEQFEIRAKIENMQNSNIIIPIKLALHEDFIVERERILVWLKPLEKKEIIWGAVSPSYVPPRTYAKYEMLFSSPDKNIADIIEVHGGMVEREPKSDLRIEDVSPYIEENSLRIEILLSNEGNLQGDVLIELFYQGQKVHSSSSEIPANTEKKIIHYLNNVRPGKILLKIESDESKNYEIVIPEEAKEGEELETKEVESIEVGGEEKLWADLNKFVEENFNLIVIAVVAVAILFVLISFVAPKMKR